MSTRTSKPRATRPAKPAQQPADQPTAAQLAPTGPERRAEPDPGSVGQDAAPKTLAYEEPAAALPTVGQLVDFETADPITGHTITGVGLVVEIDDNDELLVAPLTVQGIRLSADDVSAR